MSKSQTLRALVNERLTAAAEEIFALFETTIAEYGEELCRSVKQESQRKLLDEVNPRVLLPRAGEGVQVAPPSPSLSQEITKCEEEQLPGSVSESSAVFGKTEELSLLQQIQTEHREEETREQNISSVGAGLWIFSQIPPGPCVNLTQTVEIKEEQSVKLEEEQLLISAPKSSSVSVKSEELQQRQTEHREETEGDTELSSDTDNDDEWEPAFSCSDAQMGAEADGDRYNQVQNRITAGSSGLSLEYRSAPETSVNDDEGAQRRGHQCFMCGQTFKSHPSLEIHLRVHTGERPYSCPTCEQTFVRKGHLHVHMRTHTGDKPYSCSFCNKKFTVSGNLKVHMRVHTGEKPFRCSMCAKTFVRKAHLNIHMRTHTGDRPYSCSICNKSFSQKSNLNAHARIHAAEKPYSCAVCNKEFTQSSNLKAHMRTHAK